MNEKNFSIDFSGSITLDVSDIWPDGDAPDNPTVQDVKNVMEAEGDKGTLFDGWCLLDYIDVYVSELVPTINESIEVFA